MIEVNVVEENIIWYSIVVWSFKVASKLRWKITHSVRDILVVVIVMGLVKLITVPKEKGVVQG